MMSFLHTFGTFIARTIMLDDNCGIYAIKAPSGNLYIGSAVNFRRRWNGHRSRLMRGTHHCPGLQNACDKYGLDSLEFVKLEIVERERLIAVEQRYLDQYAGVSYNVCPTADSRLGRGQSAATRAKISEFQKGRKRSEATRARMSQAQTGHPVSESARAKIGDATRGRKASDATRQKQSEALRGKVHKDNTTGYPGVGKLRDKFRARWANKHLGLFSTAEDAYAAVVAAQAGS